MNELAIPLAVIACSLAGAMGGYALARPREALEEFGLTFADDGRPATSLMRAAGGLLLLAHGGTAAMLGYQPWTGAAMSLALALAWSGAVAGRVAGMIRGGPSDAHSLQSLGFEILMAVTLALPYWAGGSLARGPSIIV